MCGRIRISCKRSGPSRWREALAVHSHGFCSIRLLCRLPLMLRLAGGSLGRCTLKGGRVGVSWSAWGLAGLVGARGILLQQLSLSYSLPTIPLVDGFSFEFQPIVCTSCQPYDGELGLSRRGPSTWLGAVERVCRGLQASLDGPSASRLRVASCLWCAPTDCCSV